MQKYEKNTLESGHPVWNNLFHKSKNQKPKQTRKKTMIDQLEVAQ
jgi:hypothetical protein